MNTRDLVVSLLLLLAWVCLPAVQAEEESDREPILYRQSTPRNAISALQARIDTGEVTLAYDEQFGYLPSVLKALGISVDSQMLVYSKTSLQLRRITPRTPRAIYFNDDLYVGYCHAGDVLEVSAVDPQLGTVFYILSQQAEEKPQFMRQLDNCLVCHSSSRTEGVPGHLVRSLYVDAGGQPLLAAGSRTVDHTTPIAKRWGGWYVSGTHGSQSHLGNLMIRGNRVVEPVDNASGHNVTDLGNRFHVGSYLTPHSDLVALMILEHQVLVHNRLTKANFTTRQALAYDQMMRKVLERGGDEPLESTTRRIRDAGEDLVEALLLVEEAPLTEPIAGTSGFTARFNAQGPRDDQGRSLRQLDLQKRLLAYPCSYLIYSPAFRGLPEPMKAYVWRRLQAILTGSEPEPRFAHLSSADRAAIWQILSQTHPDLLKGKKGSEPESGSGPAGAVLGSRLPPSSGRGQPSD